MKSSTKSLALAAAFAGLLGGTAVRVNAQPTQNVTPSAHAGVLFSLRHPTRPSTPARARNDCKGQGGGKHPGKNSCKGKGDCATDGSKAPKAA